MKSLLALIATASSLHAATIHVPQEHASIPMAISAAQAGDVVLVAAGTYRGPVKLKPAVTLKSAGNDDKGKLGLKRAEATILEGGVEMAEKSVLDGFTVTVVGKYDDKLWQHHFDTQGNEQEHEPIGAAGTPGIAVAIECARCGTTLSVTSATPASPLSAGSPRIIGNVCFRNMGGGIGSMNGSTAVIEEERMLGKPLRRHRLRERESC
jgi:hypothetical protein